MCDMTSTVTEFPNKEHLALVDKFTSVQLSGNVWSLSYSIGNNNLKVLEDSLRVFIKESLRYKSTFDMLVFPLKTTLAEL